MLKKISSLVDDLQFYWSATMLEIGINYNILSIRLKNVFWDSGSKDQKSLKVLIGKWSQVDDLVGDRSTRLSLLKSLRWWGAENVTNLWFNAFSPVLNVECPCTLNVKNSKTNYFREWFGSHSSARVQMSTVDSNVKMVTTSAQRFLALQTRGLECATLQTPTHKPKSPQTTVLL